MQSRARTTIYLSTGIHGDEPAGPLALLDWLKNPLPTDVNWLICPLLNPRGHACGTRCNTEGIDLNRDYLRRSSDEIRAHASWLETMPRPDMLISLHEDWETTGFYFYEINLTEDRPLRSASLLEAVAPILPIEPMSVIDDHQTREPGWIYHAADPDLPDSWPEAIFLAKRGCPLSYTFESPSSFALDQRIRALGTAMQTAIDLHLRELPDIFQMEKNNGI